MDSCIMRKRLSEKINMLGSTEHIEILRILKENDVPLTENKNGVFFNLSTLDPEAYDIVENFVNYCYANKHELDQYDRKLHECKFYQKNNYLSQYSINEPKDKRDTLREVLERYDMEHRTHKMKEFVSRMSHAADRVNIKRSCGKFLVCKKQFSKRTEATDGLLDCLEHEA
jgi:isoleucyl-tRNA synthetase